MSYILDALNKSEQERRGVGTPGLDTIHRSEPPRKKSNPLIWITPLVLLALANAAFLYWWRQPENPVSRAPVVTTPVVSPSVVATQQTPQANTETADKDLLITPTDFSRTSPKRVSSIKNTDQAISIDNLPAAVQGRLPDLSFQSHIFADDESFRMVNINGKLIREGDMLTRDVQLLEITEEGVVLNIDEYVFEVSVLRDWSF